MAKVALARQRAQKRHRHIVAAPSRRATQRAQREVEAGALHHDVQDVIGALASGGGQGLFAIPSSLTNGGVCSAMLGLFAIAQQPGGVSVVPLSSVRAGGAIAGRQQCRGIQRLPLARGGGVGLGQSERLRPWCKRSTSTKATG